MLDLPRSVAESFQAQVYEQRALAYLLVDASLMLVRTGGRVEDYGLGSLEPGRPACSQVPWLEGMLPLVETPFLIPSMEMPSGRVADLHFHADGDGTWVLLLDVTAERDAARRVQQKAYDMTLLSEREAKLMRRLRAAHLELEEAHGELQQSRATLLRTNQRLEQELRDAERYVRSMLPAPFAEPFSVDWRFVPSTELGGDSFGYHWVDRDHFAFYLLDVCGHGVGAALLSVAAANTLRSEALAGVDFRVPGEVLTALNRAYPMEDHANLFFTIWYGVYDHARRRLHWASAGHPPALLVAGGPDEDGRVEPLHGEGPSVGIMEAVTYRTHARAIGAPRRLFLFSDGAYEIHRPDGTMLGLDELGALLAAPLPAGESELDRVLDVARTVHGPGPLEDDFSIVKLAL